MGWSVSWLVGQSVSWSVGWLVIFYFFYEFFMEPLLLPKWTSDLKYGSCPPSHHFSSSVSGLVTFISCLLPIKLIKHYLWSLANWRPSKQIMDFVQIYNLSKIISRDPMKYKILPLVIRNFAPIIHLTEFFCYLIFMLRISEHVIASCIMHHKPLQFL